MGKDQELLDAARTGKIPIIEKLLSPKSKSGTRSIVATFGIKIGANVNCQDQSGYTPLHHAALNGHKSAVTLLLQNAASANVSDNKGSYPLHLAAWSGCAEIVSCLLTHGPSVAKVNEQNGDKETALHCSAQYGHTGTVEILLNNGADPMIRNMRNESPLDLASQYGRMDAVRVLLQFQPSLLSRCPERFTPLHLASRNGHKEVVEILLAHGADINRSGENGSALHESALFGKPDVVRLLLSRGANPHTLDPKYRTPLELVRQLNTQTSREISQLILSRLQEGEDYEPLETDGGSPDLSSIHRTSQTPDTPHTYLDMHKAFLEKSQGNVFETSPAAPTSIPEVTVEAHHIQPPLRRSSSNASSHPSSETTQKSFGGSWGRSSIGKGIRLRRSASARSSKSLPRLPSTAQRSPSLLLPAPENVDLFRQHHPSSIMFPVSPTANRRQSETTRRSSSSFASSSPPLSLSSHPVPLKEQNAPEDVEKKAFTRERLKTDDDVFLPIRSLAVKPEPSRRSFDRHMSPLKSFENKTDVTTSDAPVRSNTSSSPAKQSSVDSGEPRTSSPSLSMNRPKKPVRSKLSTVTTPPPIPPKPSFMVKSPAKPRPPSPVAPPPDEDDIASIRSSSHTSEEGSLQEKRRSRSNSRLLTIKKAPSCDDKVGVDLESKDLLDDGRPAKSLRNGSMVTTSGESTLHEETTRGPSCFKDLPSPTFSPPSPHAAMIEISETLQKAVSQESLDVKNEVDLIALNASSRDSAPSSEEPVSTPAILRQSSFHSFNDEQNTMQFHSTLDKSTYGRFSAAQRTLLANDQRRSDQRSRVDQTNAVSDAITDEQCNSLEQSHVVDKSKSTACASPKPTRRAKPALPAKPALKKMRSDAKDDDAAVGNDPPAAANPPVAKPRSAANLRKSGVVTVRDSSECFVTGGALVKRARILSTKNAERSSVSSPKEVDDDLTPTVLSPPGRFPSMNGKSIKLFPDEMAATENSQHKQDDSGENNLSAITVSIPSTQGWQSSEDELDEKTPVNELTHVYDTPAKHTEDRKGVPGEDLLTCDGSALEEEASESRSTCADWDDALSDRTEDFEMPREVRKFRGLIRGASYRSRAKANYGPRRSSSPYDDQVNFDSDGYGAEYDDGFHNDSFVATTSKAECRASPTILASVDVSGVSKKSSMTLENVSKRAGVGNPDLSLSGLRCPMSGNQGRREMRKKRFSRRSDGGDSSPLSSSPSSPSSAEEFALKDSPASLASKPGSAFVGKSDKAARFGDHIRHDSFYDNNNNSSLAATKPPVASNIASDGGNVLTLDKLPDLNAIVDTVSAVRSRSSQGSSSDPASCSSASSTLAKSSVDPTRIAQSQEDHTENDEWAQIASIMSSIGGGSNKGSLYAKEFEETFWQIMTGSELPRQVSTWLSELGLPQYEKVLCGNGFDDVDFMAGDILEEQDLIDMDIADESHRRRLLESAQNLPAIHPLVAADSPSAPSSVVEWLASLHLPQYEDAFVTKGYTDMSAVRLMSEAEIHPLVKTRGHFKRLRASLFSHSPDTRKSKPIKSSHNSSSGHTKASPPLSRSPLLESANFFKDYNNIVKSRATTLTSIRSADGSSHAFPSGTVSSTGSGSSVDSSKFAGLNPGKTARCPPGLPDPVQPADTSSVTESPRSHSRRGRSSRKHKQPVEDTENVSAEQVASASDSRQHRRKSSRDSARHHPRSRSGSLSSRTRKAELSVFVETNSAQEQQPQQTKHTHRSSQKSISRHKSSASVKSVEVEHKQNAKMTDRSASAADIPDVQRATFLLSEAGAAGEGSGFALRPPNEATREVTVGSWRHSSKALISDCLNYQAYYLGSMLVRELKGVESTVEACAKMKRSTDSMRKIPTIMLSINYRGVKFIDSKSKHEIAEHEICNISFASQDADDLSTFAYITHDVRTGHHYCHVFRVTTVDVAFEIILTLGQAFEVAYQLILKDKALKDAEQR